MGFDSGEILGGVWIVLWWLGIVVLAAWANHTGSFGRGKGALNALRERYARGEIDRIEFELKRRDLER